MELCPTNDWAGNFHQYGLKLCNNPNYGEINRYIDLFDWV